MAWIELHQSLWTHKKTLIFASLLDIDDTYAAAHISRLWTWCLDNAKDGNLSGLPAKVICFGAGWKGNPEVFVEAAIGAGWLEETDQGLQIHDWYDYAGKLIEKRAEDAERKRQSRNKKDVQRMSNVTLPNHTVPNNSAASAQARQNDMECPKESICSSESEPQQTENFYTAHQRLFNVYPGKTQTETLDSYIRDGMEESVIIRSMERAALVGRGYNFKLIIKILNDYMAGNVRTLTDAIAYDETFENQKTQNYNRQGTRPQSNNPFDRIVKELRSHDTG